MESNKQFKNNYTFRLQSKNYSFTMFDPKYNCFHICASFWETVEGLLRNG